MLASSDWAGLEGDTQKESSKADLGIYMQRATSTKNVGKVCRKVFAGEGLQQLRRDADGS